MSLIPVILKKLADTDQAADHGKFFLHIPSSGSQSLLYESPRSPLSCASFDREKFLDNRTIVL
ncbi:hypothetical cytosolic protein [Syntrophus aciditrophicus SB]|uniref:Hypothetical cytosolic protein n=1 Tax=Syntrophus aciditrophicus (strain SB) TaxID=56780 RepID=Q2LXJ1_SYNAS|nr:hypothetical cytosolic protein [Syntrophus aciditrophicus SB]